MDNTVKERIKQNELKSSSEVAKFLGSFVLPQNDELMLSKFSPSMVEDHTIKFKNTAKDICAFASLARAMHCQAKKLKAGYLKSTLSNNANTLFSLYIMTKLPQRSSW